MKDNTRLFYIYLFLLDFSMTEKHTIYLSISGVYDIAIKNNTRKPNRQCKKTAEMLNIEGNFKMLKFTRNIERAENLKKFRWRSFKN